MTSKTAGEKRPQSECIDKDIVERVTLTLLAYCRSNNWSGYDPYDALNSRVFKAIPFLDFKLARLALTQGVKRSPINLRPLLMVPKTPNPKGIALFLSALTKLAKIGLTKDDTEVHQLGDELLALKSPGQRYPCWGYNFDWQTRGELVPRFSPNIICTTFAANALLDAYELSPNPLWLDTASGAANFVLETLFRQEDGAETGPYFSYTPSESSEVHNANLLGAAFLCRVSRSLAHKNMLEPALAAARSSVVKQHEDGSWDYGELPQQRWVDNFHTGFNLVALRRIAEYGETLEFDPAIRRGFDFYRAHFFRDDGAPKYFQDSVYPIDIHSAAQSIITLIEFKDFPEDNLSLATSVLKWSLANMWDDEGFFYFQRHRFYTMRVPFMRWSEAWMLLALSGLLQEWPPLNENKTPRPEAVR